MKARLTAPLLGLTLAAFIGCGSSTENLQGPSVPADTDAATGGSGGSNDDAAGGDGGDAQPNDGPGPDAPGVTAQQACSHLGETLCSRLDYCARVLVDIAYGDAQTCASVLASACVESLALSDTVKTPAWTDTCATALGTWSCEDLLTRNPPAACVPPAGPRPDGSPCGEDGQCSTGYCASGGDEACGHCRAKSPANGMCAKDDDCQAGLACNLKLVCAPYAALDAACNEDIPCAPWLSCTRTGSNQSACKPAGGLGDTCDAQQPGQPPGQNPGCRLLDGLFCNPAPHQCQELGLAEAGEPCGVVGQGYALCTAASLCKTSGMSGTCLAPGAASQPCNIVTGPYCEPGLKCVSGACADPDLASCN